MRKRMAYEWKIEKYNITAQEAGEELERIIEHRGELTPEVIVEESTSDEAVLHECFLWDDERAAARYREQQAADIIRNIVTVEIDGKETEPVRAFVSIERGYKPITVVVNTEKYMTDLLTEAKKELQAFSNKYRRLTELQTLFGVIDTLLTTELREHSA